ncbi:MAG: hypothetical protein WDN48_11590 [Pseudolabrys sp.]
MDEAQERRQSMFWRTGLTALVVVLSLGGAMAQVDPIAARKALMKGNNDNARAMVQTMRGQRPFDAAAAEAARPVSR